MFDKCKKWSRWQKWMVYGIIPIILVGTMMHFLYDLSGKSVVLAAFFPVNESVWEHLKMAGLPVFLWWFISYWVLRKKDNLEAGRWFTGCLVAIITAMCMITDCFYVYTGALGIENIIFDVIIFILAIIIGQFFGILIVSHYKGLNLRTAVLLLCVIFLGFVIFTYAPIHLPIFMDQSTGIYGRG